MNNKPVEPSPELFGKVMARINKEQRVLALRRRIIIFSIGFAGSLMAIFPTFQMVSRELANAGFMQFFSLIFSDFEIVLAYWQNFSLALLESLPVISLIIFLGTVFILLESLRFLSKDIKSILLLKI